MGPPLLRELQEQEQREKEESKAKLQQDELLAHQLAETSRLRGGYRYPIQHHNLPPHPATTVSNNPSHNAARTHTHNSAHTSLNTSLNSSLNSSLPQTPKSSSKDFYKHLSSANKGGTLDKYLVKGGSNGWVFLLFFFLFIWIYYLFEFIIYNTVGSNQT